MTTTHALKCWPEYFQAVYTGRKNFEIRRNDRAFQPLDILHLREFDPGAESGLGAYTGRHCFRMVNYIAYGGDVAVTNMEAALSGIAPGYVVLSLTTTPEEANWKDSQAYERFMARQLEIGAPERMKGMRG